MVSFSDSTTSTATNRKAQIDMRKYLNVDLEEITNAWEEDAKVAFDELGKELSEISSLHAKYLRVLSLAKLEQKEKSRNMAELRKIKTRYYATDMNLDELNRRGWEPWSLNIQSREIPNFVDADKDVKNYSKKVDMAEVIVATIEAILKEINNRTWSLKATAAWRMHVGDTR